MIRFLGKKHIFSVLIIIEFAHTLNQEYQTEIPEECKGSYGEDKRDCLRKMCPMRAGKEYNGYYGISSCQPHCGKDGIYFPGLCPYKSVPACICKKGYCRNPSNWFECIKATGYNITFGFEPLTGVLIPTPNGVGLIRPNTGNNGEGNFMPAKRPIGHYEPAKPLNKNTVKFPNIEAKPTKRPIGHYVPASMDGGYYNDGNEIYKPISDGVGYYNPNNGGENYRPLYDYSNNDENYDVNDDIDKSYENSDELNTGENYDGDENFSDSNIGDGPYGYDNYGKPNTYSGLNDGDSNNFSSGDDRHLPSINLLLNYEPDTEIDKNSKNDYGSIENNEGGENINDKYLNGEQINSHEKNNDANNQKQIYMGSKKHGHSEQDFVIDLFTDIPPTNSILKYNPDTETDNNSKNDYTNFENNGVDRNINDKSLNSDKNNNDEKTDGVKNKKKIYIESKEHSHSEENFLIELLTNIIGDIGD